VLIFCPTYINEDGELAVDDRTIKSIEIQRNTFSGYIDTKYSTINPHPVGMLANVLAQYQAGRAMCLEGGYDALLTVEHDMVIPDDALQKLWDANKPVTYAIYVMRHGPPRLSAWVNSGFVQVSKAIDRHPDELARALEAQVYPVSGVGFGCTLIRREILERFEFHKNNDETEPCPDVPFAKDLIAAGVQQYAHFGVACGHVLATGDVLWPAWVEGKEGIIMDQKAVYVALKSFTGSVGSIRMQFNEGDLYELEQARAASYVREGLVRRYEPELLMEEPLPPVKPGKGAKK
jgi:hypothetical protein